MPDLYRKVTALLRSHAFEKISGGKGSHEKWRNEILGITMIVPRNLKSRHTANAILRDAQIKAKL